jgi:hypothetical protein
LSGISRSMVASPSTCIRFHGAYPFQEISEEFRRTGSSGRLQVAGSASFSFYLPARCRQKASTESSSNLSIPEVIGAAMDHRSL